MDKTIQELKYLFNPQRILQWFAESLPDLILAIVIFVAFYIVWRLLRGVVQAAIRRSDLDKTAASFVDTILKYTVLTIGMVSALSQVGLDTTSILTSLGLLGLTIGFAARDALSNVISGIFIFWDRPFVLGDLVEVDGKYGRVEHITMRSTRVVTPDGKMLAIPNNIVVNTTVASYTNFPHLRLDVAVTVGVEEDLGRVERLLLGLCKGHPDFLEEPAPEVAVTAINDYNLQLELRAWIHDERRHSSLRCDLRRRIFEELRNAEVDMPLETLRLAPIELRDRVTSSAA